MTTTDELAQLRIERLEKDLRDSLRTPIPTTDMVVVFIDERGQGWAAIRRCSAMERDSELAALGIDSHDLHSPITWGAAYMSTDGKLSTLGFSEPLKTSAKNWFTHGRVDHLRIQDVPLF